MKSATLRLVVLTGVSVALNTPAKSAAQDEAASASVDRTRAQEEMKQGAQAYRAGKYDEAERHYRSALDADPSLKSTVLFLARSIRAQYRPGVAGPENLAKAMEAISVYEKALLADPNQDEAFTAVAELYGALKDESKQRDWILKRAQSERISKQRRASAYQRLADLDAACARKAAAADRAEADRCAARGLDSVEKAIALNGENEGALTQKAQLLRERAMLAQSEGSPEKQRAYEGQAAASEKRIAELREQERKKSQSLPTY